MSSGGPENASNSEEQELLNQVIENLRRFVTDELKKTDPRDGLDDILAQLKDKIFNRKKNPLNPSKTISSADLAFYQRAYRSLFGKHGESSYDPEQNSEAPESEGEFRKVWQAARGILAMWKDKLDEDGEDLDFRGKATSGDEEASRFKNGGKFFNTILSKWNKLRRDIEDNYPNNALLSDEALHLAKQMLQAEALENALKDEESFKIPENLTGVWTEYKRYRRDRDAGLDVTGENFASLNKYLGRELKSGGQWRNPDVQPIFETAYEIDSMLDVALEDIESGLNSDDISWLNNKLKELKEITRLSNTGNSETEIIYNRLLEKRAKLEKLMYAQVPDKISESIEPKLEKLGLNDEFNKFIKHLNRLLNLLKEYREADDPISLHNISSEKRLALENLVKSIRESLKEKDLYIYLPGIDGYEEIELLFESAIRETEAILGVLTEETDEIFSQDVINWLLSKYQYEWTTLQRMWQLKIAGNEDLLDDYDKRELEEIEKTFKQALGELFAEKPRDVAFAKRYVAIDVQLNRIEKLMEAIEGEKQTKVDLRNEHMTLHDYDNVDIEDLTEDQLYDYGLQKLSQLVNDGNLYTSSVKKDLNIRFNEITKALENKGSNAEMRAQYLKDRREFETATNFASTSSLTMDMDALNEGDASQGWHGAKVPGLFINEGVVFRLLYGQQFAQNDNFESLSSPNSEEQERITGVNVILEIACELLTGSVPDKDGNLGTKHEFHATQQYNENRKSKYFEQIRKLWMKHLGVTQLTPQQEDILQLGKTASVFLDLRTYYYLPYYIAGKSPEDSIKNTIGTAAKRLENGKGMYYICGKGKFFVNPALLVSQYSEDVEKALGSEGTKKNNYDFATMHATEIWADWWAPHLDNLDYRLSDDQKVSFKRRSGEMMVPGLYGAFWLPHVRGESQADSSISPNARNNLLFAAGKSIDGASQTNLNGMLDGGKAAEKFVENCEAGFVPTDDMEKDAEQNIRERTLEVIESISPTKSLIAINSRYLANNLYLFARLAVLSFDQKHRDKKEFFRMRARFVNTLKSAIRGAPTTQITIPAERIPLAFREMYGLDTDMTKGISIRDYVSALLPDGDEKFILGARMYVDKAAEYRPNNVTNIVERRICAAVGYQPRRVKNNNDLLKEYKRYGEPMSQVIRGKISELLRQGEHAVQLDADRGYGVPFSPIRGSGRGYDGRETDVFYRAMQIISLSTQNKQAEE